MNIPITNAETGPTMQVPFVDLKAQYREIKVEIDEAINAVLENAAFIKGSRVTAFEEQFAEYIGTRHCVGVGNGTDALYISLKVLGIGPGDEVITAANSFIATSEAISQTGAKVVFVDVDACTFNLDPALVEKAVSSRTKAIVPVHLYGQPADMDAIRAIASEHNLYIVEDAAQAHGAKCSGHPVGTMGAMACFSFFPGKNLGAYGDAGAIVTSDDELARRARMFANHGRITKYDHELEGINSRLDGLQAAILSVKLKHLRQWTKRRIKIAGRYDKALEHFIATPKVDPKCDHVYHLYVVRLRNRADVQAHLKQRGVATGIHYPIPLPFLKAYQYLGYGDTDFPVARQAKDEILSLPIHGSMSDAEVEYVIGHVRDAVQIFDATTV